MLLATKFFLPTPPPALVSRQRMLDLLDTAVQYKLVLLTAPAGSGKTVLLSDWAGRVSRASVVWLTLDRDDDSPILFWSYIIAALQRVHPSLGENALLLLGLPEAPINHALAALLNDLSQTSTDLVLILDDFHTITNPAVAETFAFVVDHLPLNVHLVIASRSTPQLPLARWRVQGTLSEVQPADMRFTLSETTEFLRRSVGGSLAPSHIAALEERTEGWIAGLHMVALSLRSRDDVDTFVRQFSGSHRYVLDYLVEEVLERQPPALQAFLLQTSLLDKVSADLCDAVLIPSRAALSTDLGDSTHTLLRNISRAGLFLMPLDDTGEWYRYHQLFAETLRARLEHKHLTLGPELYMRASNWYLDQGNATEAIRYALAGRHIERAIALIEQVGGPMLVTGEWHSLVTWLNTIPNHMLAKHPQALIFFAWALSLMGQFEQGELRLRQAEAQVTAVHNDDTRGELMGQAAALHGLLASMRGHAQAAVDFSHQALELLPPHATAIRGIIAANLGGIYTLNGQIKAASSMLEQGRRLSQQANNQATELSAADTLAQIYEEQGQIKRAFAMYREITTREGASNAHVRVTGPCGMANILYEWNDLDEAHKYGHAAVAAAQRLPLSELQALSALTLARVLEAQDMRAEANKLLQQAEDALTAIRHPIVGPYIEARCTLLHLRQGDVERASRWAAKHSSNLLAHTETLFPAPTSRVLYLLLPRIALAQDQSEQALELLAAFWAAAEGTERAGTLTEILLLQALAYYAAHQRKDAITTLIEAMRRAEPEDYTRMFVDEGDPMRELLNQALVQVDANDQRLVSYIQRLLGAFPVKILPVPAPVGLAAALVEPLSERELEVLRLIAEGNSNRDIAERLIVSIGTVKKHLNNIFGKLNVQSRTQAVAKARSLRLL